jgi:xylan 1,4-beta-xylosidase
VLCVAITFFGPGFAQAAHAITEEASKTATTEPGREAVFTAFSYREHDPATATRPIPYNQYRNPIIPGFYPDPSIVRVGNDFYLVNSSFAYFPGLPVWHSTDLVSWQQIGNAIDRVGMFDFNDLGVARAVFAPTIRYHNGVFYIINTCVDCGSNFLISAKNPAGPWSDPIFLPSVNGIDPDLFFDHDGRAWIAHNGPPMGTPKYDGHRAIWIQELDLQAMKMVGARTVIVDGGVKPADKPIWAEGPHIIRRDGWYYLIAAEGGTAGDHSETVYRSRTVTGPYTPGPVNPILTQRDLNPKRPFPIYATGHADFVETKAGDWWAVFLGTRPYETNLSNMGRETFMLPVHWPKGEWPLILPKKTPVPRMVMRPKLARALLPNRSDSVDSFDNPVLSGDWLMLRPPKESWYSLSAHRGALTLTARPVSLGEKGNPSFIGKRQKQQEATYKTELHYAPVRTGDRAGLAIFSDEQNYYFFGVQQTVHGPMIVVTRRTSAQDDQDGTMIASARFSATGDTPIRLSAAIKASALTFAYAVGNEPERVLIANVDGRHLASERSNQFTGVVVGLYAQRAASVARRGGAFQNITRNRNHKSRALITVNRRQGTL